MFARSVSALALLAQATVASGQTPAPPAGPATTARSDRIASYSIDARLDPATRTLHAEQVLTWRNATATAAATLPFHLYYNAWRNTSSTWMREQLLTGDPALAARPAADWSWIDIASIRIGRGGAESDATGRLRYIAPDDGNREDRTVAEIPLDAPAQPGETLTVRMTWSARVPRTVARTGAVGDYFFVAQWFPKMAVFEADRWTAHQFHANTEFFSDYGRYDVRMTVPRGWLVGATGVEQARTDNADGSTTHRYVQDDVHDFAWTTSPDYLEQRRRFTHDRLPAVDMRLLLLPEHRGQEDRHFDATAAALRWYGEWYGAYPYGQITIIDPAFQSGAGGMEYPTLFTAGTQWIAPRQSNTPEGVTIHEAGHQFWYAMVGNNEFDDAWLDEGLNTFSEARVQSVAFQPDYRIENFFGGFLPWQYRDIPLSRATDGQLRRYYVKDAERDPPSTPSWRYWPGTHQINTYAKTALWLHTLERYLGWETLQRILSTFFERWKFRHPRPEDFFRVANEVSGQDLTWFFDQVYRSSNEFDYGIEQLDTSDDRTTVVVRRFGEATFPVEVVTTFADGSRANEQWGGLERWRAYTYPRRAVSAAVDPERVLLLDVNFTNNSRTTEPRAAAAATKWSATWMVWLQDLLLTWSFFV